MIRPLPLTEELPLVSIVIPAYNEAELVERNLDVIAAYTESLADRWRFEIIVIDDGSTDGTGELADAWAAKRPNARVLHHPTNFNLGQALRYGFRQSRGDYVVTLDLDLTYAPEHVAILLEHIEATRAKIVLASPYMRGGRISRVPLTRRLLSRWGNRFLALTARGVSPSGNVSTLTGMVRAYDGRFVRSLNLTSLGAEINTEVIYKAMILGARIEEVPAHLDWSGQPGRSGARVTTARIRRGILFSLLAGFIIRPFAFFIIPALGLALTASYILFWVGLNTFRHFRQVAPEGESFDWTISEAFARAFEQSPHAFVVGGIMLLLAVQLFSLGVLALQVKQYFEELFHFETRVHSVVQELAEKLRTREPG